MQKLFSVAMVALAATTALRAGAADEPYPSRPIKLVVAYSAGGGNDLVARAIGQKLSAATGQPVVIENKAGANGAIGSEYVSKSAPDGYTLLLGGFNLVVSPVLFKSTKLSAARDFTPIMNVLRSPLLIVAGPSFAANNGIELIKLAKTNPGSITYAGQSGPYALNFEVLNALADIKTTKVPYRGTAEAMADITTGRVSLLMESVGSQLQSVRAGRLKAIAVTGATRHAKLPEVPTLAESGVAGYDEDIWLGVMGPPQMDPKIVQRLSAEFGKLLTDAELLAKLDTIGYVPAPMPASEFTKMISTTEARFHRVAAQAGIKPE